MREPTVHALGSVLESKKAKNPRPKLWGGSKQFAYGLPNAVFFASYWKCASRSKIEPAAAATTMAHSSTSLRSDSDRPSSRKGNWDQIGISDYLRRKDASTKITLWEACVKTEEEE